MKKFLKFLVIIIVLAIILYIAFMYIVANYLHKGAGKVEVDINRNYSNETEERLINLAEDIDCDLSDLKIAFRGDVEAACITKEEINGFLVREKEYLTKEDNQSTYIREYNARVNRNKGWPIESGDGGWFFAPTILDASNNTTTPQTCLDKVDNYWLVFQSLKKVSGNPDKLAGSGADSERYLMFDDNMNLICQYLKNESWIN